MTSTANEDVSTASLESHKNATRALKIPAVVTWIGDDNCPQCLSHTPLTHDHVTFDIYVDHESNTAFFKITANIAYKGKRHKSNLYLFIYPEHILSLDLEENDDSAATRLGTSTNTITFKLATPPSLIVPDGEWVPKNEEARAVLALAQSLARKNNFSVAIPSKSISLDRLGVLCQKASCNGCLQTMTEVASIAKLYGGQGGMIVEHGVNTSLPEVEKPGPALDSEFHRRQAAESPPSYDELGSPPPHPPIGKKRRRLDSDVAENANQEKLSVEDICRRGFAEMGHRFDRIEKSLSDFSCRLDRVEQFVKETHAGESRPRGQHNQQPRNLDDRIDGVEERVTGVEKKLDIGLSDLARDIDNQLYDVRHEFNDTISIRVDDEMGVVQSQLEDFVKDELHNAAFDVEEKVKETLRDALA